jgi:hypothetical protein
VSRKEIAQALNIEGGGGYDSPLLSARARSAFFNSANFVDNQAVIVLYASRSRVISAQNPSIKPGLPFVDYKRQAIPATPSATTGWSQEFGHWWVSETTVGGEFYAYYECRATSGSTTQALVAALNGAGFAGTGTADASLHGALAHAQQSAKFTVRTNCKVVGTSSAVVGDYFAFAEAFPGLHLDEEALLAYNISSYAVAGLSNA